MHLSRRNLLLASSAAAVFGSGIRTSRAAAAPPKYFVLVFANGGWDVTYCLDPKQDAVTPAGLPTPIQGPWGEDCPEAPNAEEVISYGDIPIQSNLVTRPSVDAFFSKWSPRSHVVNGIWTGSIAHAPCRIRLFTGSTNQLNPDSATIFGYEMASTEPLGTLDLSGLSFPGPLASSTGRLGFQSQLKALVDPASRWPGPEGNFDFYPQFVPNAAQYGAVQTFLQGRTSAFDALRADGGINDARVAGLLESRERAARFKTEGGIEALSDVVLGKSPSFATQAQMAANLFRNGLCRSVVLNSGSDWDTHISNEAQHGFYENLFSGLDALAEALSDPVAGNIFEDTLVVVVSEMTRTPQFNASCGKDHWAHTSALLFGGPVRGNAVSGATNNENLESEYVNLTTGQVDPSTGTWCQYDNFTAGILEMLGLDSQEWLPGVTPFLGARAV